MIVKMLTHITWWCTLGGVDTFTKEKKLELMWINPVKKRVQNFTVGVSARIEKTGFHRLHRTLVTQ